MNLFDQPGAVAEELQAETIEIPKPKVGGDFINRIQKVEISENKPPENNQNAQQQGNASGGPLPPKMAKMHEIMDGEFAARIFDIIASLLLSLSFEYLLDVDVPRSEFTLKTDERKVLEPILKEILKRMNIDLSNPYIALGIAGASIYGAKTAAVYEANKEKIEKVKREKEQAEKEDRPYIRKRQEPDTIKSKGRGRPRKV